MLKNCIPGKHVISSFLLAGLLLLQFGLPSALAADSLPPLQEADTTLGLIHSGTNTSPERDPLVGAIYQADYIINAGDRIALKDATMGDLVTGRNILSDGSINLPLLGKVFLAGMSVKQAKEFLHEQYGKYFVDPRLNLQVSNQRPVRVYVMGAVANPGVYISGKNLSPSGLPNAQLGNYEGMSVYYRLYLVDALIMAGGLAFNADVRDIRIKRAYPKPMTIHVNLMELFQNGNLIQDIPLRDQDVIEVTELPDNAIVMDDTWEEFARNNVNQNTFQVNVLGAVDNPGNYSVQRKDNVLHAIAMAGGFSDGAAKSKVFILRTTPSGQVVKRELNMTDRALIGKKPFEAWASLLPNDVIVVGESTPKKVGDFGVAVLNRATTAAMFPLFNRLFANIMSR